MADKPRVSWLRTVAVVVISFVFCGLSSESVLVTSESYGTKTQIPVTIYKPGGSGPFPAVVWLHDCSGLAVTTLNVQWSERLVSWGYLVAVPDSFGPRGRPEGICADVGAVAEDGPRISDAFATLRYLQARPDVIPAKVGVQGHSHGAGTVFALVQEHHASMNAATDKPGFAAAVAYYPYCSGGSVLRLATPLLVLIGAKDDWTPPEMCELAADGTAKSKVPMAIKVYPTAFHGFDNLQMPLRTYLGHQLGYDAQAAEDSFAQTKAFFGRYLKGEVSP